MIFVEKKDYEIEDDENTLPNMSPIIKILSGKYKNTRFRYHNINMEQKNDEIMRLHFDYEIIEEFDENLDLLKNNEFKEYIGNLLNHFLISFMDKNIKDLQIVETET